MGFKVKMTNLKPEMQIGPETQIVAYKFPDTKNLTLGITNVLKDKGLTDSNIFIVNRTHNNHASTFPTEIVTCKLANGNQLQLFCKYVVGRTSYAYGHRGDVEYEAKVYRHVLQQLDISTPNFYGFYRNLTNNSSWLVIEYLDKCKHAYSVEVFEEAMRKAACWIGRFHALNEAKVSKAPTLVLNKYNLKYYRGWANRTSQFAGHLHKSFTRLKRMCAHFNKFLSPMLITAPLTVIHGEYYPDNILFRRGVIYPIDWQSAAIGIGEIDLASLTEGRGTKTMQQCESEYQHARWPDGPPHDFKKRLEIARLYLHFRWLGYHPNRTTHEYMRWRFEELCSVGERLGLI